MPTLLVKNVEERTYFKLLELKGKLKCKTYSELLEKLIEICENVKRDDIQNYHRKK